jgi:signal transduction histidine kinase
MIRKYFFAITLFIFCACFAAAENVPTVRDITKQWASIEQSLLDGTAADAHPADAALVEAADTFYHTVRLFENSEMYRIYKYIPSAGAGGLLSAAEPAGAFRDALAVGGREQAVLLSADVRGVLDQWLVFDWEAERFSSNAYFRLLVAFIALITVAAIFVKILSKTLANSLKREAEGLVFSNAYLLAQEEERERISRELHDTIAQDLRCLSLGMEKISRTEDAAEREKLCGETAQAQSGLIGRVRDICDNLIPPDFRFHSLGDALRRLCLDFAKRTNIDCRAEIAEGIQADFLDHEKQLQAFPVFVM